LVFSRRPGYKFYGEKIMQGEAIYKKFNGFAPRKVRTINMAPPKALVCLGRAVGILYESNKVNGGGTGRLEYFKHTFHRTTKLYTDEKGKKLYVFGPQMKVNSRGIIN
jgi:hypothetical protein